MGVYSRLFRLIEIDQVLSDTASQWHCGTEFVHKNIHY